MRSHFPLKDIAFQSGLSLATVDRVVHDRPGVRQTTRARVSAAIAELERQYGEAGLTGRRLAIDVVMEAPQRFSDAVRSAFEAELPGLRPAAFSARFHLAERMREGELDRILNAIARRGSHGVLLKAPRTKQTERAASSLMAAGIPVVTFVTDIATSSRIAYVGMDNRPAGANAAHLMGHMLGTEPTGILLNQSSAGFAGEAERCEGFRQILTRRFPHFSVTAISEGHGVHRDTFERTLAVLSAEPSITAVYSVGGANAAIIEAFAHERRKLSIFAAHDLDAANRRLLAEGRLTFVIHHDLRQDARSASQIFLHHHRMLPTEFSAPPSRIGIATPYDVAEDRSETGLFAG